ncbi:NERD domain-containing protein, partial [bacterium]|nr:NERD domain-containing protein [bacterium]
LEYYLEKKEKIILERGSQDTKELAFTKEVVEELYNLIAGAVGENLVVKEIQKLPDEYFLFNNFSMEFNPPIFNRKENDRIYSIQIDHLLVSNSGIFILETKNWSKESIKNLDLRSPIKQITRTSYALFVLLNSESEYDDINLHDHHWGNKQIPIRNIIVMINEKPNEKFKYVKVKTLNELNGYVTYFEPIFNNAEVESISNYLRSNMQDHNDVNNLVL